MIEIIPSLSVLEGQLVRLPQGDYSRKVVYDESPIETAKKFQDHGVMKIHFIDLDGARDGRMTNYDTLRLITGHTKLSVNVGGGINSDGDLHKAFEGGASMVTIGNLAINRPGLFASWLISYGMNKIVLSADTFEGEVRVRDWKRSTGFSVAEHIGNYYKKGILYVKCADVSRDGTMQGPAFQLYKGIIEQFPHIKLMASGGISSMDDIKKLEDMGVYAALIGKSFYENKITLKDIEKHYAKLG